MRAYRNGEQIVMCDGCFGTIDDYKSIIHNITVGGKRGYHAHNMECCRKAKANPPNEVFCSTEGCGLRIALGEVACMNKHPIITQSQ